MKKEIGSTCRLLRRLLIFMWMGLLAAATVPAKAEPVKTVVQDTVYRADGTVAHGTVTITWPAFTSAGGEAVAAGTMTVKTDASGAISVPLIPNTGSSPAGTYYRVVIRTTDGVSSEEQWVVPAAAKTTISAIRAKVVPQSQAAQFVGRDYVDSQVAKVSGALSAVAVSGKYEDLADRPTIPSASTQLSDSATLVRVGAIPPATESSIGGVLAKDCAALGANYVLQKINADGSSTCVQSSGALAGVSSDANGLTIQGKTTIGTTVLDPSAGIKTPQIGKKFYADGYASLDDAFAAAKSWIVANNAPAVLELGQGIYDTCSGLQMPTTPNKALSIVGQGKGEFGKGSTIRASCAMNVVIQYPYLASQTWWNNLTISHLTIDANNLANSCADLYAQRMSRVEDVSCTNAVGDDHWFLIGDTASVYGDGNGRSGTVPSGHTGQGLNVFVRDLFLFNNATATTQWAKISPVVTDGAITGYTIANGGQYRQAGPLPVVLMGWGNRSMSQPCTTMPTNVKAQLAPIPGDSNGFKQVTSITFDTPGAGCAGDIYVQVPDIPKAKYGLIFANTDSTTYDVQVDTVGQTAAIQHRLAGDNVYIHDHAWQSPVLIQDWGRATYIGPECDNPIHFCFTFPYTGNTKIISPHFYWYANAPSQLAGSSAYYIPVQTGVSDIFISNEDCGENMQASGGYARFAVYGYGPLDTGDARLRKYVNGVLDGKSCQTPAAPPANTTVDSGRTDSFLSGVMVNNELKFGATNFTGTPITPYLIATLPAYAAGTDTRASVVVRMQGGQIGSERALTTMILSNGSSFFYDWNAMGNATQANRQSASIVAYQQPGGRTDVYLVLGAYGVASVSVELVQDKNTVLYSNPQQVTPAGTLVFDSSNPASFPYTATAAVSTGTLNVSGNAQMAAVQVDSVNHTSVNVGLSALQNDGSVHYRLLASLPVDNSSNAEKLHIKAVGGSTLANSSNVYDITIGNRGNSGTSSDVSYVWSRGSNVAGGYSPNQFDIKAYWNSDKTVDVYAVMSSAYTVADVSVDMAQTAATISRTTVFANPTDTTTAPSGTVVFDTSDPNTYPYGSIGLGSVKASKVDTGSLSIAGTTVSSAPVMVWSGNTLSASSSVAQESSQFTPVRPISVVRLQAYTLTGAAGCTTPAVLSVVDASNANAILTSVTLANGTQTLDTGAISVNVPAGHAIAARYTTAAAGCTTFPSGVGFAVQYQMQ